MRELGVPVAALWVAALLAAMLVAGIANYRFHSADVIHLRTYPCGERTRRHRWHSAAHHRGTA